MRTETVWPTKPKTFTDWLLMGFQPFDDVGNGYAFGILAFFFMNKKTFSFTGLCGKKQKEITKAIKRAQILGKNI